MDTKKLASEWLYLHRKAVPWKFLVGAEILTESGHKLLITEIVEREWPSGPLITVCTQDGNTNHNGTYNAQALNNGLFKSLIPTIQQAPLFQKIINRLEQDRIAHEKKLRERAEIEKVEQEQAQQRKNEQEKQENERREVQRIARQQVEQRRIQETQARREEYIEMLKYKMTDCQVAEADSIRNFIVARRISHLVHFTRIENVSGILNHGITPRASLPAGFHFNDEYRLDRFPESISLSIDFPNWQMFYRYRCAEKNQGANWAVLSISTEILLMYPCMFFPTNAANGCFKDEEHELFSKRMGMAGLTSMFFDRPPGMRAARGLAEQTPTDPQAEILMFNRIPLEQIVAISLMRQDPHIHALVNRSMPNVHLTVGGKMFAPRSDYTFWQTNKYSSQSSTSSGLNDIPF